jgi:hypothetical protein
MESPSIGLVVGDTLLWYLVFHFCSLGYGTEQLSNLLIARVREHTFSLTFPQFRKANSRSGKVLGSTPASFKMRSARPASNLTFRSDAGLRITHSNAEFD